MEKKNWIKVLPHIGILLLFLGVSFAYFYPVLEGKELNSHDTDSWHYASKEARDFNATHKEPTLWTNSMFGGMPTYQITMPANYSNVMKDGQMILSSLPTPVFVLFLYLICFYILLLCMGCNKWLSVVGSLFFSFASYNLIIIAAGHITKAIVIAYMAPFVGSIWLAFRKNRIVGSLLTSAFLSLMIANNHLQILYYTIFVVLFFGVVELVYAIKNKQLKPFFQTLGLLLVAAIIAVGMNATNLMTTYEYSKYTMRGDSNGLTPIAGESKPGGLDKDYITAWSYGIDESFTLLIPDFKGGASGGTLPLDSETGKTLKSMRIPNVEKVMKEFKLPLYWGTQPMTSGPVYLGAIVCFLFVLGMFLVDKKIKWWLVPLIILSLMLSWGKNFMPLTDFFIDHIPMYNKFRTVSMMLVVTGFCVALVAALGLKAFLKKGADNKKNEMALFASVGITGGLCLLFWLIPSLDGTFVGRMDAQFSGGYEFLKNTLPLDRKDMMQSDAIRSLVFILLSGAVLYFYNGNKLKLKVQYVYILLAVLVIVDLWVVDKRYLNESNFVAKRKTNAITQPSEADKFILQDKNEFRVLDISVDIFNDAKPSYFHKNIGGYSAVKLSRYQELIEHYLADDIQKLLQGLNTSRTQQQLDSVLNNVEILNMLNMKYLIYDVKSEPIINPFGNKNAWFVSSARIAENADQEMEWLGEIKTKEELVVDEKYASLLTEIQQRDSNATISLTSYEPNHLKYQYDSRTNQIAVFSEIYYDKGWNAYVDGQKVPYFRANYLLRAMSLKPGSYEIEFKFEPQVYKTGNMIAYVSSGLFILLFVGSLIYRMKMR